MNLEKVVGNLSGKVDGRFYGKYRGLVVDNADPKKLGRLQVTAPSVLGPDEVTGWATPCVPFGGNMNQGFLFIPEVGAGVWVEFEEGKLEFPIWTGTFWSEPDGESELPVTNGVDGSEGEIQDPPTRKIIKTVTGHTLQFEDADGEERIIISDGQTENRIVLSATGIALENKENSIVMTDDGINVTDGTNGHQITLHSGGITIADATENQIEMSDSAFNIVAKTPLTIDASGQPIVLIGDTIDLNKG